MVLGVMDVARVKGPLLGGSGLVHETVGKHLSIQRRPPTPGDRLIPGGRRPPGGYYKGRQGMGDDTPRGQKEGSLVSF